MNITYIRQRTFFKKTQKAKAKLKLSHQANLQQSKLSTFPSQDLTLQEQLFTMQSCSPEKQQDRQPLTNRILSTNQNIPPKTQTNYNQFQDFLKKRQSESNNSPYQPTYGLKKVLVNQHKSDQCRNPNYTYRSQDSRHHASINSYHTRPTICPSNKQKIRQSKRNDEEDMEKRLSILQKKIREQLDRSEQTFDGLDQLQKQMQEGKKLKEEEFKKEASVLRERLSKQMFRNTERQKTKKDLLQEISEIIFSKNGQKEGQGLCEVFHKALNCQLYRRYPQGLSESPQAIHNRNQSAVFGSGMVIHQSNISDIQCLQPPSSFRTSEQVDEKIQRERSKMLGSKNHSNRSTFAIMNQSLERESESILLDDSIFG